MSNDGAPVSSAKVLFVALLVATAAVVHAQQPAPARKPIVPLPPAELLKLLPSAPPEWTMTQSTAKNFFVSWLCAQATREFQRPAPQPPEPGAPIPPPLITRLRLIDTGYYPSFNGDFENFKVGRYSNAESLLIFGQPSRRIILSDTRERLRVSLRGRFIVEVETDNQRPDSGKPWLQYFDLRRIANLPDAGSAELPKPIQIQTIDEMRPGNNSSSQLHWGGAPSAAPEQ